MKRTRILITSAVILLALLACTIDIGGGAAAKEEALPLQAVVDAPADGSNLPMGPVQIKYHATAPDGITALELSINGQVVNSSASPEASQKIVAQSFTWNPAVSGNHVIRVRAQGANGVWSGYGMASVNIVASEEPVQQEQQQQQEQPTETPKPTNTPEGLQIINVKSDVNKFFYLNTTCGPNKITFTAEVTQPDKVYALLIFTRFEDLEDGGLTKWDASHAMKPLGGGKYTITLESEKILNYNTFEFALMHYQLVAQDKAGSRLVATEVVKTAVRLEKCP